MPESESSRPEQQPESRPAQPLSVWQVKYGERVVRMSDVFHDFAQYGVETTAQPAASANVRAPDAICSRLAYGVRKTSVSASRSDSSSPERNRSSNTT